MSLVADIKKKLTLTSIKIYIVLLVIFLVTRRFPLAYGLTFGYIMGVLNFYLLANTLERALQGDPARARVVTTVHYIIRYILTFVILLVAIMREDMHIVGVVIGLLLMKIIILTNNAIETNRNKKAIFSARMSTTAKEEKKPDLETENQTTQEINDKENE